MWRGAVVGYSPASVGQGQTPRKIRSCTHLTLTKYTVPMSCRAVSCLPCRAKPSRAAGVRSVSDSVTRAVSGAGAGPAPCTVQIPLRIRSEVGG